MLKYRVCGKELSTNHRRRCNESTNLVFSYLSRILSMSLQGSPSYNSLVPLKVCDTLRFLDMAKIAMMLSLNKGVFTNLTTAPFPIAFPRCCYSKLEVNVVLFQIEISSNSISHWFGSSISAF